MGILESIEVRELNRLFKNAYDAVYALESFANDREWIISTDNVADALAELEEAFELENEESDG